MAGDTEGKTCSPERIRPQLVSQQSNSVPSTPQQRPRKISTGDRTPSPVNRRASLSPRVAASDSAKSREQYRAGPVVTECRFKTTQPSRRRIPYSIGDQVLDKPHESPKHRLTQDEHNRMCKNIERVYQTLLPSQPGQGRREQVLEKLRRIISDGFPGKELSVQVFGSSGNLLFTDQSDVDICVTMKELETTCVLAELLARNGMKNVKCVHAKAVPIVKIWDPDLDLNCDLNLNNHVALKNTRMVKAYIELDERVRPLAMIIKHWTRKRIINEASGGTLSSYTWTLLLINFLQTREPPVLPRLELTDSDGRQRSDFRKDLDIYRGFGDSNQETLAELLFSFFRRYGYELNFQTCVISVREARLLSKREKFWDRANNNRLCVEEPFNTDRNLANTADDFAWRGLHLELRRAFQLVAEAKDIDSIVCEQYEFPPEPRPTIERQLPTSRPPTISRSLSQTGKGARNSQSTRGNRLQYGRDPTRQPGSNSRRASSAATMGHTPYGPVSSAPQLAYPTYNTGFHEHLSQISRQLSQEEYRLRQKLAQQSTAADQMRYNYPGLQQQQQSRPPSLNGYQMYDRNGSADDVPSTAPLPQLGYPYLQWTGSQIAAGWPSPTQAGRAGTDTNPPSPSQTSATLRRGIQRNPLPPSAMSASRSQSQPPRSAGLPSVNPQRYGQAASGTQYPAPRYVAQGADGQWYAVDPRREPSVPIEYLGYGFRSQPYYAASTNAQNVMQVPPGYGWRQNPQHRHTMTTPATADNSRSPSPLREAFMAHESMPSAPLSQAPSTTSSASRHRTSDYGMAGTVNGSYRNDRSLGDDLASMGRPRRVSDSAGYYQPQALTWRANGTTLGANESYQPSLGSSQELEPFPQAERDRDTHSEAATTDDGQPISEASSRCNGSETTDKQAPSESDYEDRQPMIVSSSSQPNRRSIPTVRSPPQEPSDAPQHPNGRKTVAPLDLSASLPERVKDESSLSTAKVLSPVQETRTPSPTPKRISRELSDVVRLNGSNGSISSHRPRQLPDPPTPLKPGEKESRNGDASAAPGKSDNPWQQVGKKTVKKNRSRGEPMPEDVSQRKGG